MAQQESSPEADTRIRLEGAWERLEAGTGAAERLRQLLGRRRWRRELLRSPDLIGAVLRGADATSEAEASVEAWVRSNEPNGGPAAALLARHREVRESLHRRALRRFRTGAGSGPVGALRALEAAVLTAIPGGLRPGERRVLGGHTGSRFGQALLWFGLPVLVGLGLGFESVPVGWGVAAVFGAVVLGIGLRGGFGNGEYMLTTERLLWWAPRGEAVELELRDLRPEQVELTMLGAVIIESAPGPVVMPLVGEPDHFLAMLTRVHAQLTEPRVAPE